MLIIQGKSGKILEINKEIKEYNNVLLVTIFSGKPTPLGVGWIA